MRNATAPREQETPENRKRRSDEAERHDGPLPSLTELAKRVKPDPGGTAVSKDEMGKLAAMVAGIGKRAS